jgi:outer membrane protein TolC
MNLAREAAAAAVLAALLPGAAFAQQQPPASPAVAPPAASAPADAAAAGTDSAAPTDADIPAQLPKTTGEVVPPEVTLPPEDQTNQTPQPAAPTPTTPLPKRAPDPKVTGITDQSVKQANLFNATHVPGQPLSGDPSAIRTLQDALSAAFARNPTVLLAQERVLRTGAVVNSILALRYPQVGVSGSYTRLANPSSFATGASGLSPSSITNPFGVGLTTVAPGTNPITLSTVTGTTGGVGSTTSTTTTSTPNTTVVTPTTTAPTTTSGILSQAVPAQGSGTSSNSDGTTETSRADGAAAETPHQSGSGSSLSFSIPSTDLNQVTALVSVSQLVDITGVVRAAIQVGDLESALTRLQLAQARQQTALTVTNAYYSVLKAEALVRVNEAAVADGVELLRITRAKKVAGILAEFDILQAQTQLANARQALISSRNQVAIAKNYLANLIGLDPSTPIEPEQVDVPPLPSLEEEALIQQAYRQRPEYLEADVNILVAQKNVRLARRTLEPYMSVGVIGEYDATPSAYVSDRTTGSVGVTLTVPLYDGGATRAQVAAARSDERGALVTKDQYARGVKSEVQQAIIAVKDADDRSLEIAATVGEAREALRLANVRLQAGIGTQLDIFQAEATLIQAEDNQVNALYDYLGAMASLSRAIGTPV